MDVCTRMERSYPYIRDETSFNETSSNGTSFISVPKNIKKNSRMMTKHKKKTLVSNRNKA